MKPTQKRLVKTILRRRQTMESLHSRFEGELTRMLKSAIASGKIKAVETYQDGFRFIFCRPDYPEKKLHHGKSILTSQKT